MLIYVVCNAIVLQFVFTYVLYLYLFYIYSFLYYSFLETGLKLPNMQLFWFLLYSFVYVNSKLCKYRLKYESIFIVYSLGAMASPLVINTICDSSGVCFVHPRTSRAKYDLPIEFYLANLYLCSRLYSGSEYIDTFIVWLFSFSAVCPYMYWKCIAPKVIIFQHFFIHVLIFKSKIKLKRVFVLRPFHDNNIIGIPLTSLGGFPLPNIALSHLELTWDPN